MYIYHRVLLQGTSINIFLWGKLPVKATFLHFSVTATLLHSIWLVSQNSRRLPLRAGKHSSLWAEYLKSNFSLISSLDGFLKSELTHFSSFRFLDKFQPFIHISSRNLFVVKMKLVVLTLIYTHTSYKRDQ